jgi:phosphatidate cytidylyltransferase
VNNQLQRILVAAIGIPVALGLVWYGGLPLVLLVTAIGVLGTREFYQLVERSGGRPLKILGLSLAALVPVLTWVWGGVPEESLSAIGSFLVTLLAPIWLAAPWPLVGILVLLVVLVFVLFARAPDQRPMEAAGTTLLGFGYAGVLPCVLLLIRSDAGPARSWSATWLVFFPLVVTWICDSFAMWGGKAYGKAKLWPTVSPGKTQAGAIAGVVGGVLAALVYPPVALWPLGREMSLLEAGFMGLVISVVSQVADLVESLFKREAGVKDSSGLIPGHGGILDRFDSLYFVLPVTLLLYRIFGIL